MVDYVKLSATANRLISKFGRSITLIRWSRTATDVSKPWRGSQTPRSPGSIENSISLKAAFVKPASLANLGIIHERDDGYDRSHEFCMIPADSVGEEQIRDYDEIIDGDVRWRIDSMQELKPGDRRLLYLLRVER